MKKLLILTTSISVDEGRGRYAVDLIKKFSRHFEITVFTSKRPNRYEHELDDINLKIHDLPGLNKITNPFVYFWCNIKLLPYFLKADMIHYFSDYPYSILLSWLPFVKKPLFFTIHGTYGVLPLDNLKTKFLVKRVYKKAKKIFCVSKFTEKQVLKRIKLNNTIVINNGVDYNKFQISEKIELETLSLLSVGALKPRKGYHISIPAIAEVKKKYPNIKYYIVGGKPQKIYTDLVKNLNLEKNIEFLQNLSDKELIKLYYKSNIFLLTSVTINDNDFEGFGLVYLEAGACGRPVVGAYGSGAEDAIIDGETGILVPQNDVQKTAEAILKLLDNPELAKKMGENGKKFAQKMDWKNMVDEYVKIYEN
jgi:glycosyltransferase involved in cell wall biosynthesis